MSITPLQWLIGILAAIFIGFSKTGVPGVGIVVVPFMALIFPGRISVGTTGLLLLAADVFAVAWYRQHTRWDKLTQLMPWVVVGMLAGFVMLFFLGEDARGQDSLNKVIGALVLVMIGVYVLRLRFGDQLRPTSQVGLISTGASAGFSTMVSNAAGPIMSIYMTSLGLPKMEFMGTSAWYYLIFNATKIPLYILLTVLNPARPMFSRDGVVFDVAMLPMIVIGVFLGRWMLPRLSQTLFNVFALSLSAVAAIRLLLQ